MSTVVICKNFGSVAAGRFCAACAQPAGAERITWHWIARQVPHVLWHFDRGFGSTLPAMYRRPGQLIRDYWRGVRMHAMNPLSLLAVMVAISALNTWLFASEPDALIRHVNPRVTPHDLKWMMFQWQHPLLAQVISLPFLALGTWRCFGSFGRTYGEHLVMNIFTATAAVALGLPIAWAIAAGGASAAVTVSIILVATNLVFFGYVWIRVFWPLRAPDDTRFEMAMRCLGALLIYGFVLFLVTNLLIKPLIKAVTFA